MLTNPFDVFKVTEIVAAINEIPNNYGKIRARNIFPVKGVSTNTVTVESREGVLSLIQSEENGGPGVVASKKGRKLRTFNIPTLVYDDQASPREVQDARAFGTTEKQAMAQLLNEKLTDARAKHDITLEHLRMGALKGRILDADGSLLYDLYEEFGIEQPVFYFDLENPEFDVRNACRSLARYIRNNLKGETMRRPVAWTNPDFFEALISHESVKEVYANWGEAADKLGGEMDSGFKFGGMFFEEYEGSAVDPEGNVREFIASGEAHAFPEGTTNMFKTLVGPPDFVSGANKPGRLYYAKTAIGKFERHYDLHTQAHPLPICYRPGALPKIVIGQKP